MTAPAGRRPPDRHVVVGVSHASDDPTRHRVFEIRASFRERDGGWVARIGEQNANEQIQSWDTAAPGSSPGGAFPTAAACLGAAVAHLVAAVDREAGAVTGQGGPFGQFTAGALPRPASPATSRPTPRWWPRRRRG